MDILKGDISITDNLNFVKEILFSNVPNTKIINLDENGIMEHPNIIGGTCLLPPIDALIAEADGDEVEFDKIYNEHFMTPFVDQFIGALIICLMAGTNLILYYPEMDTNIVPKLMEHVWKRYGIGIGIINKSPHNYDYRCIPIWLGYAYSINAINGRDYLYAYPEKTNIPPNILDMLIMEFKPFGDYNQKISYIYSLVSKLKKKQNIIIPIYEG